MTLPRPNVSVIVPCYNEEATIRWLLEALYQQSYPRDEIEVIISDGMSTDCTRQEINSFQLNHPGYALRIIDNPDRAIPSGLNRAIQAARGEYIVRLDAHSIPYPDYIENCIRDLEGGLGDNVGGIWEIRSSRQGWLARSIAVAASHPLGVGDALYRHSHQAQQVDTVPFGAFRRSLAERLGGFNEKLESNEDYEFNVRIRQGGGKIWLDPTIRSIYFARSTLITLARQYWRYGYWKARMIFHNPETLRWRQVLPPVFVLTLLILSLGAVWTWVARFLLLAEILAYLMALGLAALLESLKRKDPTLFFGLPLAIATMHLSWGTANLWGIICAIFRP